MYYAFVLLSFLLQEVTDEVATDPSAPQLFLENMGKVLQWVGVPALVLILAILAWKFLPGLLATTERCAYCGNRATKVSFFGAGKICEDHSREEMRVGGRLPTKK